ncbi:MAG TPA: PAS domain S-box protein [Opitutaceae bacterium]|nr:PAS domain S-box protein [Opitutaceae bacterium]
MHPLFSVYEHTTDIVARFDPGGRYVDCNRAVVRMGGVPADELIGSRVGEIAVRRIGRAKAGEILELRRAIRDVVATAKSHEREVTFSLGSERLTFAVRLIPEADAAGRITNVLMLARDLTALKRAETAVAAREQELAELQRRAEIGTWTFDLGRRAWTWSDEMYRLFGSRSHVHGARTITRLLGRIHAEDRARVRAAHRRSRRQGEPFDVEFRVVQPGGAIRILRDTGHASRDSTGAVVGLVGTTRDFTAIRRAEQQAHEAEERFRLMFETSPVAQLITQAPDGRIREANPKFLELLGYEREEVLGRTVLELNLPTELAEPAGAGRSPESSRRGQPLSGRPIRAHSKSGHPFDLAVSGAKVTRDGAVHALAFLVDAGELRRASEQLQQARTELTRVARASLLGELTASIAHEVKQPLTGVITNAEACLRWLRLAEPDLTEATAGIQRIIGDANRASDVVTRIRSLLKKAKPVKAPVQLDDLVRDVLVLIESETRRRGVALRARFQPGLSAIAADRVQLQQVLMNLVMNSLDSFAGVTDRSPEVTIEVVSGDSELQVAVVDNGTGLTDEEFDRIFEPFFTTKDHGIGLGLSISRAIIESHGGKLWASPNKGPGVRMVFTLPCR